MTTGIGNEWDPGDPPEIHKEVSVGVDLGSPNGDQTIATVIDTSTGAVIESRRFYTRVEVCDQLKMNHSTLARWEQKGLISQSQRINGVCVYSEQQLAEIKQVWEASTRNLSTAEMCTNCHRRKARTGSTLCSRCSYSALENQLRSTLPNVITPEVQKCNEEFAKNTKEFLEETIPDICPSCGSDDPSEKKNITSGPEEFPIVLPCEDEWHQYASVLMEHAVLQGLTPGVKYYNRRQVADQIGVSPTTICRWEQRGHIPAPMRLAHNNQLYYTEEHIQKAKEYYALVEQVRVVSPIAQAAHGVGSKSFSKLTEKTVAIHLPKFRRGGLI